MGQFWALPHIYMVVAGPGVGGEANTWDFSSTAPTGGKVVEIIMSATRGQIC